MEIISLKLPAMLRSKLAAEAKRRNVPQSLIVREALERALSEGRRRKDVTCSDLARDLIGSVRSGRSDLATNKALLAEAVIADYRRGRKRRR